jgi:hypothetical protein
MTICKGCGVELDADLSACPLCDTPVSGEATGKEMVAPKKETTAPGTRKKKLLRQVLWQVTSVLLLSGIIATLAINLAIKGSVTWSIYPVSICLIIFSYASLMALWHTKIGFQLFVGWLISTGVLFVVSRYTTADWPLQLALPVLSAVNAVGLLLMFMITRVKAAGLNILAIIFVAIAVLCLLIEGIVSFYLNDTVKLQWSVIVAACLLPVTAAILFMYLRTRNNTDLQKIFHT